jgi:alpha 1,2-mannosyltransferase
MLISCPRPDVHYHCDVKFDPFLFMEDFNKTYSFTITLYEFQSTIATLWDTTKGSPNCLRGMRS